MGTLKIWCAEEDGCVDHWMVAEDEAQARGLLVGNALATGYTDELEAAEFELVEMARTELANMVWYDDCGDAPTRTALDILDEQAAKGPGYVACSEF